MKSKTIMIVILAAMMMLTSCDKADSAATENSVMTPSEEQSSVVLSDVPSVVSEVSSEARPEKPSETPARVSSEAAASETTTSLSGSAEQILSAMTPEQKVGQLFIIRPEALEEELSPDQINSTDEYGAQSLSDSMAGMLKKYPAGGIAIFGKNLSGPDQITGFISSLQQTAEVPLFISVDEEGGTVSRIANTSGFDVQKFPDMQTIGKTGDVKKAYSVGSTIGSYLRQYGFNLDFAPVCDVNTNPNNIVIGKRAFGSNPSLVASMVSAEVTGFHDSGMICCSKHFPGHGDTEGDTHDGFVSITKNWDDLKKCEMLPFVSAMNAGVDLVMVAHISAPNITSDGLPSSMSHQMITDHLRDELGFNGVVITDSMSMGAINKNYTAKEAAVRAVLAGADIILMPDSYVSAFNGVIDAVQDGTISQYRLDQSVLRILTLKQKYGLLR